MIQRLLPAIIPFSNLLKSKAPQIVCIVFSKPLFLFFLECTPSDFPIPSFQSTAVVNALPTRGSFEGMGSMQVHRVLSFFGSSDATILKFEISEQGGLQEQFALGAAKYIAHPAGDLQAAKANEHFPT